MSLRSVPFDTGEVQSIPQPERYSSRDWVSTVLCGVGCGGGWWWGGRLTKRIKRCCQAARKAARRLAAAAPTDAVPPSYLTQLPPYLFSRLPRPITSTPPHPTPPQIHNLVNWPGSSILRRIWEPCCAMTCWSVFVSLAYQQTPHWGIYSIGALVGRWVNGWVPGASQPGLLRCPPHPPYQNPHLPHHPPPTPPPQIHALLGSALGLLLVFRTNTAYNRFWEGRKIWEKLLNISRSCCRLAVLYNGSMGPARMRRSAGLLSAFPHILLEHLQGRKSVKDLSPLLSPADLRDMKRVGNRPLCVLNKLSKVLSTYQRNVGT